MSWPKLSHAKMSWCIHHWSSHLRITIPCTDFMLIISHANNAHRAANVNIPGKHQRTFSVCEAAHHQIWHKHYCRFTESEKHIIKQEDRSFLSWLARNFCVLGYISYIWTHKIMCYDCWNKDQYLCTTHFWFGLGLGNSWRIKECIQNLLCGSWKWYTSSWIFTYWTGISIN